MSKFRSAAFAAAFAGTALAFSLALAPAHAAGNKPAPQAEASPQVRSLQLALNRRGARLPVDGKMNAKTVAALKAQQRSLKLNETGELDAKTRAAFGIR